ncbi:MAG: TerC family protein [Desulfarculus sp.]|nr:TerC family protein [Desulfarculus sp.]
MTAWLSPDLLGLEALTALVTLTALEIVLGIDNIVFIAIMTGRLPAQEQPAARRLGLMLAMVMRILLLLGLTWVMRLTAPLMTVLGQVLTGRDLILLGGGGFLIAKATHEIHGQMEGAGQEQAGGQGRASFWSTVAQIGVIDIIFSLDSVITAVGMARHIAVMVLAVVLAVVIMIVFSGAVSRFIHRHPTVRVLALSFLILIGVMLFAEGLGRHIERGYVYFAMAFSLLVEMLNMRMRKKAAQASGWVPPRGH